MDGVRPLQLTGREALSLRVGRRLTWPLETFVARWGAPAVGAIERDVAYLPGAGPDQVLDVLVPRGEGPWPVVMMVHGGGFILGDKRQLERTCRRFAEAGFLVFNVNYRLAPEHPAPAQIEDCAAALRWVRESAAGYGGDPERVCVGGGSAGGYLAAALGLREPDALRGALLLNGVFDFESALRSGFPRIRFMARCFFGEAFGDAAAVHEASLLHQLDDRFPPALVAVGTRDSLHGQSLAMVERLSSHGVTVELEEYADSNHGWFNWFWTENSRSAHEHMIAWLRKRLH